MQANPTTSLSSHHSTINDSGTEWVLRGIASMQILGGLFGAGRALALLFETGHPFNILALLCYICGMAAGLLLWQQTLAGFATSLLFQIVQIPWILTARFSYALVSGVGVWLGAGKAGFVRDQTLVSWFHFGKVTGWGISLDGGPWHIGINLVAVGMAAFLISNWPKRKFRRTKHL